MLVFAAYETVSIARHSQPGNASTSVRGSTSLQQKRTIQSRACHVSFHGPIVALISPLSPRGPCSQKPCNHDQCSQKSCNHDQCSQKPCNLVSSTSQQH